jgi:hypothetical protein
MALAQRCRNLAEQGHSAGRNADTDGPAIVSRALADYESALGQIVEHSCDVGGARHEPPSQLERQSGPWMVGPQQTKQVVLLWREIETSEQLVFEPAQAIVRPPEIQERFLFERVEALASDVGGGDRHKPTIVV